MPTDDPDSPVGRAWKQMQDGLKAQQQQQSAPASGPADTGLVQPVAPTLGQAASQAADVGSWVGPMINAAGVGLTDVANAPAAIAPHFGVSGVPQLVSTQYDPQTGYYMPTAYSAENVAAMQNHPWARAIGHQLGQLGGSAAAVGGMLAALPEETPLIAAAGLGALTRAYSTYGEAPEENPVERAALAPIDVLAPMSPSLVRAGIHAVPKVGPWLSHVVPIPSTRTIATKLGPVWYGDIFGGMPAAVPPASQAPQP